MANIINTAGLVNNEIDTTLTVSAYNESATITPYTALFIPHDALIEDLDINFNKFSTIVLEFPTFADGRAYTQARLLKDRFKFNGKLRATGEVKFDQLSYMYRCGFDEFALAEGQDPAFCKHAFTEISANLQSCFRLKRPPMDRLSKDASIAA